MVESGSRHYFRDRIFSVGVMKVFGFSTQRTLGKRGSRALPPGRWIRFTTNDEIGLLYLSLAILFDQAQFHVRILKVGMGSHIPSAHGC